MSETQKYSHIFNLTSHIEHSSFNPAAAEDSYVFFRVVTDDGLTGRDRELRLVKLNVQTSFRERRHCGRRRRRVVADLS